MKATTVWIAAAAFAVLSALNAVAQPYNWYTLAGLPGYYNFGWVDGTNSDARLGQPAGIAADARGDLYIADLRNNGIRKITHLGPDWVVTTLAGSTNTSPTLADGTNSQAHFYSPQGVAVDSAGTLYVADSGNNAIRKMRPVGTNWVVTTIARGFNWPEAVAVDDATNLYVADMYNAIVRKLTPVGTNWVATTIAGLRGQTGSADGTNSDARFNLPSGMARDAQGNLYVADYFNYSIRQLTPVGTNWVVSTIAGSVGLNGSVDGTNSDARFNIPQGTAVDAAGTVYVMDSRALRKIVHSGTNWIVTTLGQANGPFGWGQPNALAFDGSGNLFVADTYNNVIRLGLPAFSLQAAVSAGQLALSWPAAASNYFLETTTTLGPGSSWTPLTNGINLFGDSFVLTNALTWPAAFFRLHQP